jgi:putative addiction module component (TIGR02574 family)
MTQAVQDILKQALQLSPADRLTLAQELCDSVDPYPESPVVIDDALMEEIRRRDAEMDAGMVHTREEMMAIVQQGRACNSHSTSGSQSK